RDQDAIYGTAVTRRLRAMGIRDKPIAPGSPWQNGYAERLIGTIRRECLDHLIVLGEAHKNEDSSSFEPRRSHSSGDRAARRHHIATGSRRPSSPILSNLGFRHAQARPFHMARMS